MTARAVPNPLTWLIQRDVDRMLAAPARTSWPVPRSDLADGLGDVASRDVIAAPARRSDDWTEAELREAWGR